MRVLVLSSAWAHGKESSGYELSDFDNFEFFRENPRREVDVVFRPRIDTPFP